MNSNWREFIKDFGDAIGGIFIGYSAGTGNVLDAVVGTIFILTSIYLRFYDRK